LQLYVYSGGQFFFDNINALTYGNFNKPIEVFRGKNWSQEKLAVESGISYNTIIKIERGGIKNPKIETVIKLADALDITLDELIGRKHL